MDLEVGEGEEAYLIPLVRPLSQPVMAHIVIFILFSSMLWRTLVPLLAHRHELRNDRGICPKLGQKEIVQPAGDYNEILPCSSPLPVRESHLRYRRPSTATARGYRSCVPWRSCRALPC